MGKCVSYNCKRNLPTVLATIMLCDPDTGHPLAIMDGTYITEIRTGAAGGVAVKYLARRDSSIIGMIGAGRQARTLSLWIEDAMEDKFERKQEEKQPK